MLKSVLFLAIFLLVASSHQELVKGCYRWNTPQKTCLYCENRPVSNNGCGPLMPKSDLCEVHFEKIGRPEECGQCKGGYGLTLDGSCGYLGIPNCVQGLITSTKKICNVCGSGLYPTKQNKGCGPLGRHQTGVVNCLWGSLTATGHYCEKCKQGYVVNRRKTSCVKTTYENIGCLVLHLDSTKCEVCDAAAGYSMQPNLKCVKVN